MNGLNYWAQTGQAPLGRWPIWDFEMFVLSRLKATEITKLMWRVLPKVFFENSCLIFNRIWEVIVLIFHCWFVQNRSSENQLFWEVVLRISCSENQLFWDSAVLRISCSEIQLFCESAVLRFSCSKIQLFLDSAVLRMKGNFNFLIA